MYKRQPRRGPHAVVGQNAQQLLKEADLRYSLVRLRENAESIAFYGGEAREAEEVGARLDRAVANKREILGTQRNLEFFTTAYTYLVQILPVLVVSPLYFAGTIELGVVTQSAAACESTARRWRGDALGRAQVGGRLQPRPQRPEPHRCLLYTSPSPRD